MASPSGRPTYSRDQITLYFERLKLSEKQRVYSIAGLKPEDALDYLRLLQQRHLAHIPFENLSLHYSPHRQVPLHHDAIFTKIIADNNGRGGYCMENNRLFGTLLYSLGFTIYSGGGRVFVGDHFTGWGHMINMVTIGPTKYHVDVGFGANGPIVPMPLERSGTVQPHIEPASTRLQWRNIPENSDPNQRLWVYEHRIDDASDFQIMYCFTELEFLPNDYHVMNLSTSTSQRSVFTNNIMMEKKLTGDDGRLIGNLIVGNKNIKWRISGQKEREIIFESEQDRVNALEEHFGMKFGSAERDSIRGLPSEIK